LVVNYAVSGKRYTTPGLLRPMNVHRITRIPTFNAKGFVRYKDIEAVRPEEV